MDESDLIEPVSAETLLGSWRIEWIGDRPVVDRSPAGFEFLADGKLAGVASCNRILGSFTLDEDVLSLNIVGLTRRMCPPALMEQEQRLVETAKGVASAEIRNGLLTLLDADGNVAFVASRLPETEMS